MNYCLTFTAMLFLVFATGCSNKQKSNTESAADTEQIKEYFPVYDFLATEISNVDSLPVGLKYYHTSKGKTDSGYITHTDFDKLVSLFTPSEIKPEKFKNDFKETSFYDRASKTSTFMYEPLQVDNPVKRIDILTKATDSYDKVSSIYIHAVRTTSDSSVVNKMIWKTGRFMQLNQEINYPGKPSAERQIKVVWNNWEETP